MKWNLLLLLAWAAPATAGSAYLECIAISPSGNERQLKINLNEAEGTAQFTVVKTGFTESAPAMFTPNEVTWATPVAGFRQHMTVNRSTLAFSSHIDGIGDADEHGKCIIPKANAVRQF